MASQPLSSLSAGSRVGEPSPALLEQLPSIHALFRLSTYLAVGQIFLQSNALLKETPFRFDMVKKRLLGHWGTTGGLTAVYSGVQALIRRFEEWEDTRRWLFVTGPGHGAPAILGGLFVEGAISHFFPDYAQVSRIEE
jgi:xylulose-5-phosphate/fructose-6-phosphate phosphoketolase